MLEQLKFYLTCRYVELTERQGKRKAGDMSPKDFLSQIPAKQRRVGGYNKLSAQIDSPRNPSQHDTVITTSPRRRTSQNLDERESLSFEEVYQGGNAQYKHTIAEFPLGSREWWILKCDEHHLHFGLNPLMGAAKHLAATAHNGLPKHFHVAVELLGYRVRDCDQGLVAKNNAAVKKAFEMGYKAFNGNRSLKAMKTAQRRSTASTLVSPAARQGDDRAPGNAVATITPKRVRPFTGITDPVPGQLYLGYWSKTKTKYAIMVFPFLGGLEVCGMHGNLASVGLVANAPRCVRVKRSTQEILGWAKGYEDGGVLNIHRNPSLPSCREIALGPLRH